MPPALRQLLPGLHAAPLLSPPCIPAALADVGALFDSLRHKRGGAAALLPYFKQRSSGRRHIEVPLRLVEMAALRGQLPTSIANVLDTLHETLLAHLFGALAVPTQLAPRPRNGVPEAALWTQEEWPVRLAERSVLRLVEYPLGVGCPPHYDPGLCTALLLGSAPGLEVADPLPGVLRDGKDGPSSAAPLPAVPDPATYRWRMASEVLAGAGPGAFAVLHNLQLERLSAGRLAACWHRVNAHWGDGGCLAAKANAAAPPSGDRCRHNIVVELRLPSHCCYPATQEGKVGPTAH